MDKNHMSPSNQSLQAERLENFRLVTALTAICVGLNNAMQAIGYHYPPADFSWVKISYVILDMAVVASCLLLVIGWYRLRKLASHTRTRLLEEFVQNISRTAMVASWVLTLLALQAISEWTEPDVMFFGTHDVTAIPPTKHYMQILLSCMTLSYGLFFLLLYRKSAPGEEV